MRRYNGKLTALLVTSFASFVTPFLMSSVNVALPTIGKELGADAVVLTWIASVFLLATAVFILPAGRLGDLYGRKLILKIGLYITTISLLMAGFSVGVRSLIFWRMMQGVGGAFIFGTSLAILTSVFQKGERGKAIGINLTAVYTGLTLGPFIGGLLTTHLGWRSIFHFLVPFGILSIILAQRIREEWADSEGERFDLAGSVLYGVAIILIMYSLSVIPLAEGYIMLSLGLIILLVFIIFETKNKFPIVQVNIFRNRGFSFSSIAALMNYSATFAVTFIMSLYLQFAKGLSPERAGLMLLIQPVMMAVFSPITGKLSDSIEPRYLSTIGMALTGAGLSLLIFITESTGLLWVASSLFCIGMGFSLFSSPNMNAIMGSVEKKHYGIAGGIVATMRLLGQMLSMGIAMLVLSLYMGRAEISQSTLPAFIASAKIALAIFAALCFAGTYFSMARGNLH